MPRVMQRSSALKSDDLVERNVGPAARHRRGAAFAFGRQRRKAAVRGLHDQRSQPVRLAHLGPVADAHLVGGDLFVVARVQAAQALDALGELFVGEVPPVAEALGPLHRRAVQLVDGPHAVQIGVAPRRARRGVGAGIAAPPRARRCSRPARPPPPERARRNSIGAVACSSLGDARGIEEANPAPSLYTVANGFSVKRSCLRATGRRFRLYRERGVG